MVKRLLIRIVVEVISSVGKSAMKAYQETAKQQRAGGKAANPLADFLNQAMQTANLTHKPMNRGEALKILHIEEKDLTPEVVLKRFWIQFHKNDPIKGGSFYIQSMVFNAKQELLTEFPNIDEKELIKTLGLQEEQKQEAEQNEQAKDDTQNKSDQK